MSACCGSCSGAGGITGIFSSTSCGASCGGSSAASGSAEASAVGASAAPRLYAPSYGSGPPETVSAFDVLDNVVRQDTERFGVGIRGSKGTAGINPLNVWKELQGASTDVSPTASGSEDDSGRSDNMLLSGKTIKEGDKRLISYAVDQGTRITTAFDSESKFQREMHFSRGVLTVKSAFEQYALAEENERLYRMTQEQNDELTRVGPGTVMGTLMRRYWVPAALSSELKPDGDPMRLMLLGEKLIDRMVELWLNTPFEGGRHARRGGRGPRLRAAAIRPEPGERDAGDR